jgi:hypothetical protein
MNLHKSAKKSGSRQNERDKNYMSDITDVLGGLVNTMGLDRRLKEHTLMTLWPALVGELYASKSRPLFIDHESTMVVAVKDASAGQELSLRKLEIIKKVQTAARSIGIAVTGLRFDLKHFHRTEPDFGEYQKDTQQILPQPSEQELREINLSDCDILELEQLRARLSEGFNTIADLNERIIMISEKEMRLRQWQREHEYPSCSRCASPAAQLHGNLSVCNNCFFITI